MARLLSTTIDGFLSSPTFASGFTGTGWRVEKEKDGTYRLTIDSLTVRGAMRVYQLLIEAIRSVNGGLAVSPANGTIKSVTESDGAYIIEMEGDTTSFVKNDIARCKTATVDYVFIVDSVSGNTIKAKTNYFKGETPEVGDELVQWGNTTDEERQSIIYITSTDDNSPYIEIASGYSRVDIANNTLTRTRLGKLDGLYFGASTPLSGTGLYSENVYLTGALKSASGAFILSPDGSGSLANGKLSWDKDGNMSLDASVFVSVQELTKLSITVNGLSSTVQKVSEKAVGTNLLYGNGWTRASDNMVLIEDDRQGYVGKDDTDSIISHKVYLEAGRTYTASVYTASEVLPRLIDYSGATASVTDDDAGSDDADTYLGLTRYWYSFTIAESGYYGVQYNTKEIYRPKLEEGALSAWSAQTVNQQSTIEQTSERIRLEVKDDFTEAGIDITSGKANIHADLVEIVGDLELKQSQGSDCMRLLDEDGIETMNVTSKEIGKYEDQGTDGIQVISGNATFAAGNTMVIACGTYRYTQGTVLELADNWRFSLIMDMALAGNGYTAAISVQKSGTEVFTKAMKYDRISDVNGMSYISLTPTDGSYTIGTTEDADYTFKVYVYNGGAGTLTFANTAEMSCTFKLKADMKVRSKIGKGGMFLSQSDSHSIYYGEDGFIVDNGANSLKIPTLSGMEMGLFRSGAQFKAYFPVSAETRWTSSALHGNVTSIKGSGTLKLNAYDDIAIVANSGTSIPVIDLTEAQYDGHVIEIAVTGTAYSSEQFRIVTDTASYVQDYGNVKRATGASTVYFNYTRCRMVYVQLKGVLSETGYAGKWVVLDAKEYTQTSE